LEAARDATRSPYEYERSGGGGGGAPEDKWLMRDAAARRGVDTHGDRSAHGGQRRTPR